MMTYKLRMMELSGQIWDAEQEIWITDIGEVRRAQNITYCKDVCVFHVEVHSLS